eukprot:Opistho-2@55819
MKQGTRLPAASIALASAFSSEGRSRPWMTSNRATASAALLDCSWPTRCSSTPENSSRSAGHLSCASCTRFSPKTRCPAWSSGRMASASWVLDTAIRLIASPLRSVRRAARSILSRRVARRSAASMRLSVVMRAAIGEGHVEPPPQKTALPPARALADDRRAGRCSVAAGGGGTLAQGTGWHRVSPLSYGTGGAPGLVRRFAGDRAAAAAGAVAGRRRAAGGGVAGRWGAWRCRSGQSRPDPQPCRARSSAGGGGTGRRSLLRLPPLSDPIACRCRAIGLRAICGVSAPGQCARHGVGRREG